MPGDGRLNYMHVELQGVRTLVPEEGVAYMFSRTPAIPHYGGLKVPLMTLKNTE